MQSCFSFSSFLTDYSGDNNSDNRQTMCSLYYSITVLSLKRPLCCFKMFYEECVFSNSVSFLFCMFGYCTDPLQTFSLTFKMWNPKSHAEFLRTVFFLSDLLLFVLKWLKYDEKFMDNSVPVRCPGPVVTKQAKIITSPLPCLLSWVVCADMLRLSFAQNSAVCA